MTDSGDWEKDRYNRLIEWIGDFDAVDWLLDYFLLLEFFDDRIDGKTKAWDPAEVCRKALVDYPCNPFWLNNYAMLMPMILMGFRNASFANRLEARKNGEDLIWSYVARQVCDLTMMVIELTRGRRVADELELEIHDWAMNHPNRNFDTYDEYCKEHS